MKRLTALVLSVAMTLSLATGFMNTTKTVQAATTSTTASSTSKNGKDVIVYFPNWSIYNSNHQMMLISELPWDRLTVINHAFFTVNKEFKLETTDLYSDFDKPMEHSEGWEGLRGFFGEYKYYKQLYPDVKVLASVGGWTRGENFHAMTQTAATRKIFIDSCIEFLKEYPFIDGIDIDWEYPGIDREKDPNDQWDRGCPGGPEDKENYTALMKEIREAYNANGLSDKMLTIADSASQEKLDNQEPQKFIQYLDYINVMTYDIHGAFENVTNHHAPLYQNENDPATGNARISTESAMKMYTDKYGIDPQKLNVGSPFYSRGWSGVEATEGSNGLFCKATGYVRGSWDDLVTSTPGGQYPWFQLKGMENSGGWVKYWDDVAKAPYLYNASQKALLTYEDEESLTERCKFVNENNYGGIIVWEITGDDKSKDFPMTTIIANEIGPKAAADEAKKPVVLAEEPTNDGKYDLKIMLPKNCNATSMKIYENDKLIDTQSINPSNTSITTITKSFTKEYSEYKPSKDYIYRIELTSAAGKVTTATCKVTCTIVCSDVPTTPDLSHSNWTGATSFTLNMTNWGGENGSEWRLYEDGKLIYTGDLVYNGQNRQSASYEVKDRLNGTYTYYCELVNPKGATKSKEVQVTVTQASGDKEDNPVEVITLAEVAKRYRLKSTDAGYDAKYDLNNDGIIDIVDIVLVAKQM